MTRNEQKLELTLVMLFQDVKLITDEGDEVGLGTV